MTKDKAAPGSLGAQLRIYRQAAGLTQKELAVQVGYKSPSILSQVEMGINMPSTQKLVRLANVLGCSLKELWPATTQPEEPLAPSLVMIAATLSPRCRQETATFLRHILALLEDQSQGTPSNGAQRRPKGHSQGVEERHSAAS